MACTRLDPFSITRFDISQVVSSTAVGPYFLEIIVIHIDAATCRFARAYRVPPLGARTGLRTRGPASASQLVGGPKETSRTLHSTPATEHNRPSLHGLYHLRPWNSSPGGRPQLISPNASPLATGRQDIRSADNRGAEAHLLSFPGARLWATVWNKPLVITVLLMVVSTHRRRRQQHVELLLRMALYRRRRSATTTP